MLTKVVIVFLGVMVLVGLIGKALFPNAVGRMVTKRRKTDVCGRCGRYLVGSKGCDCGRKT
jgi:hypothetical protein